MSRLIVGCGYLGHRVGREWLKSNTEVYAVTRKPDRAQQLAAEGFVPLIGDITQPDSLRDLKRVAEDASIKEMLFAVGMDRTCYNDIRVVYVDGLRNVLDCLPQTIERLVYISSTGVYGDANGDWVNETTPPAPTRDGGKACVEAETMIRDSSLGSATTILRLAGIYGPGRVPTRNTVDSRDWSKLSPNGYLNLIHVLDAATVVDWFARQPSAIAETFNVSDGQPIIRKLYYDTMAELLGIGPIPWSEMESPQDAGRGGNKKVCSQKLFDTIDFQLTFGDYKTGLKQASGVAD